MQGLYVLKSWYTRRLAGVVHLAVRHDTSPDVFTALGVGAAGLGGVAVAAGRWPLAGVLLAGRLAGANLDGAVARARGVQRPWGSVLNEVGDRASDIAVFAGLAVLAARTRPGGSAPAGVALVAGTALAASLPTFASLAVAAAGGTRANGGPLGKTERCLLVVLATADPRRMVWWTATMAVGSVLTASLRLLAGRRELARPAQLTPPVDGLGGPA